jgi:hypothetical protein
LFYPFLWRGFDEYHSTFSGSSLIPEPLRVTFRSKLLNPLQSKIKVWSYDFTIRPCFKVCWWVLVVGAGTLWRCWWVLVTLAHCIAICNLHGLPREMHPTECVVSGCCFNSGPPHWHLQTSEKGDLFKVLC